MKKIAFVDNLSNNFLLVVWLVHLENLLVPEYFLGTKPM